MEHPNIANNMAMSSVDLYTEQETRLVFEAMVRYGYLTPRGQSTPKGMAIAASSPPTSTTGQRRDLGVALDSAAGWTTENSSSKDSAHLPGHRATRADANTHGCYMNCIRMKVIRSSLRRIQILKNPKITQTMRVT